MMLNALSRIDPDRRQNPRTSIDVPCTVFWSGLYEYAAIRNISIYGAQLEGFAFPPVGTAITIVADRVEICASIIWVNGERCGVLLAHDVDPLSFIRDHAIRPVEQHVPRMTVVSDIVN